MLMLWTMPRPTARLISDAPPWVMNGSGMPGDRHDPDDHPDVDEELEQDHRGEAAANSVPNGSRDRQPATRIRQSERDEQDEHTSAPMNPSSWARTANTKSLSWTGRKSRLGLRPVRQALAEKPPEPTAICDWYELVARALRSAPGRGRR